MKGSLGALLHIANSYPGAVNKKRFYAMKTRILERFGKRDGFDIQHIKGKDCWTCEGSGVYVGYHFYSGDEWRDTCNRCWGTGWYKQPVWVRLERFDLGGFVFHTPRERLYEEPEGEHTTMTGYVKHANYGYRKPEWACFLLGIFFDWTLMRSAAIEIARRFRVVRLVSRHCITCKGDVWSLSHWECRHCRRLGGRSECSHP